VNVDGPWTIQHTGYEPTFDEMESRKDDDRVNRAQSAWA
jgi:hypothetical protein